MWMGDTSELVQHVTLWNNTKRCEAIRICSSIIQASVVHSTWSSRAMWRTHAPTFNKWQKKKKTLHILTYGTMRGCGQNSLVVCIHDKFHDIRERNVTIRSQIWTTKIHSLGFWDIRECVTLWWLILWSLGCTRSHFLPISIPPTQQFTFSFGAGSPTTKVGSLPNIPQSTCQYCWITMSKPTLYSRRQSCFQSVTRDAS